MSANEHREDFDYLEAMKELEEFKRDLDENQRIIKMNKELDEQIANLENNKVSLSDMDAETKMKHIKAVFGEQAGDFLKYLGEVNDSNARVEVIAESINKSMRDDDMIDDK